jgi:hypothetical protein
VICVIYCYEYDEDNVIYDIFKKRMTRIRSNGVVTAGAGDSRICQV